MSAHGAADRMIVLDRDGTLVVDRGYLSDPAGLEFGPGAAEGLRHMYSHGYRLIVISNQSGVGRGFFTLNQLHAMNLRLASMVEEAGARLEGIYTCPHHPDAGCECRKPKQGLLTRAAIELGFDPATCVVIGDKDSDIEFGRRAGAKTILIAPDAAAATITAVRPDVICGTFAEAARAAISLPSAAPRQMS